MRSEDDREIEVEAGRKLMASLVALVMAMQEHNMIMLDNIERLESM
jgi:hypothetical protein